MIIHDYREITKKSDISLSERINENIFAEYLSKFDEFHLNEQSRHILNNYIRYLSRKSSIGKQLSYNFMIHCSDPLRAKAFVTKFNEMTNSVLNRTEKPVLVTEKQFLKNSADTLKMMKESSIFAIYDCLPLLTFAPEGATGKAEEIKQKNNLVWEEFTDLCADTPDVCKIVVAPEHILRERFRNNEHLYFRVFRNHIYIDNILTDEIFDITLKEFTANGIKYNNDFKEELQKYINIVYPKADLKNQLFVDDLVERILTHFYGESEKIEELSVADIPFYNEDKNHEDALAAMDSLIGLEKVKEAFLEIPYMLQETSKEEKPSLHMAFVGNPGTGKTTVAQLAADLFYSMGVIQKNKVITVSALDLKGRYIGETPRLTKEYCKRAYGGILFIDEAYLISQSQFGSNNDQINQECIGTLLQEMENNRDQLIVIFAGYPKEMDNFLYKSNAGLGSRLYKVIEFEDYSDDELMEIFTRMCQKEGYSISREANEKVRLKLTSLRYSKDFGNARTVRNIFIDAKKEYRRQKESADKIFEAKHIVLETGLCDYNTLKKELNDMIGLEAVKSEVAKTIETIRFSKENNIEIPISNHMLFLGNSGTGKSTVAKLFGQMLFSIGASKSPNCENISAGDLLGRNNPIEALQDYCSRASGGVLFIDEAYVIQTNPRSMSIISILLEVMEEEKDNITIILAGYESEMNNFLNENQGLKSRFPVTVHFKDYSEKQLTDIFVSLCSKYGFSVSEKGLEIFKKVIKIEKQGNNFGNARTVRNIFEQSFRLHAQNFMKNPNVVKRFELDENDIVPLSGVIDKNKPIGFTNR